jgi:putative tryptophan/tyrosine transport system substrate-binding protein
VRTGLVASLARPGGNITGIAILTDELTIKNLELLKGAVPKVSRVAVLWNPGNPVWAPTLERLHEAGRTLSLVLHPVSVRAVEELESAFATAARVRAEALLVVNDELFNSNGHRVVELAAKSRLPAVYGSRSLTDVGELMSYAPNFFEMLRREAMYVDKILKGVKPGDLPIEQPTQFELRINPKTAKQLGLTIPPSILIRADHIIERGCRGRHGQ